jgi:hypothetical protein
MALSEPSSASISCRRGAMALSSRAPASVVDTLRVVRVRRRMPSRASRASIAWLNPERDKPSCAAAFVKLRSRATTTNACRSFRFCLAIG